MLRQSVVFKELTKGPFTPPGNCIIQREGEKVTTLEIERCQKSTKKNKV